jgi:hypothetical protein
MDKEGIIGLIVGFLVSLILIVYFHMSTQTFPSIPLWQILLFWIFPFGVEGYNSGLLIKQWRNNKKTLSKTTKDRRTFLKNLTAKRRVLSIYLIVISIALLIIWSSFAIVKLDSSVVASLAFILVLFIGIFPIKANILINMQKELTREEIGRWKSMVGIKLILLFWIGAAIITLCILILGFSNSYSNKILLLTALLFAYMGIIGVIINRRALKKLQSSQSKHF